ncbi:MAG: hypothetical protein JWP86_156 [Phenylobacterium sp.]|nr:hypothetical protein [Phenylobacterium sp.]
MQAGAHFLLGFRSLHHPLALPVWVGIAIGWAVAGAALWKGGWSERLVAIGFLAAWLVTPVLRRGGWEGPAWTGLAVDGLFLALLVFVALRTRRWWPLFATAFELLSVLSHIARLVDPGVRAWAYATADAIWTYFLLTALALGTYNRWRDRRQLAANVAVMVEPGATRR